jgi:hypothetical protein
MSNAKSVNIGGTLPFDFVERLGNGTSYLIQFLTPSFGLRLEYSRGIPEMRPNENGGRTAYYDFTIEGVEAVAWEWLEMLCLKLEESGAEIDFAEAKDIEDNRGTWTQLSWGKISTPETIRVNAMVRGEPV